MTLRQRATEARVTDLQRHAEAQKALAKQQREHRKKRFLELLANVLDLRPGASDIDDQVTFTIDSLTFGLFTDTISGHFTEHHLCLHGQCPRCQEPAVMQISCLADLGAALEQFSPSYVHECQPSQEAQPAPQPLFIPAETKLLVALRLFIREEVTEALNTRSA